jgi:hypothetical protein
MGPAIRNNFSRCIMVVFKIIKGTSVKFGMINGALILNNFVANMTSVLIHKMILQLYPLNSMELILFQKNSLLYVIL